MSEPVNLVTFGDEQDANETANGIAIPHVNINTIDQFRNYLSRIGPFIFMLFVVYDSFNGSVVAFLAEARTKFNQIIGIFHCYNSIPAFQNQITNMNYVSKQIIQYKIKNVLMRFLEEQSIRELDYGRKSLATVLEQQREFIIRQFYNPHTVKVCHILLIPLNTTITNVYDAKANLERICSNAFGNEYKFEIHTLFDYIPEDEYNSSELSYIGFLEKYYKGHICHIIRQSSLIRMYVVGNEPTVRSIWSQKLVALESNTSNGNASNYIDQCTFIINRPVYNQFRQNLVPIFGSAWQIETAIPKSLDDISNDIYFHNLPMIYDCLQNRQILVNMEMRRLPEGFENDHILSDNFRFIQLAINGSEERQESNNIDKTIFS